ncbi:MAG: hypothetical protein Kow0025_12170 [Thermodesulfovibrionales bacterium]
MADKPPEAAGKDEALALRAAYEEVSPLIEAFTSEICPGCESVCCIDRHGSYEAEDSAFARALGQEPPPEAPRPEDTEPCRFLGREGCRLPRFRRPYRCTWYFCQRLLESMPARDPRGYRRLVSSLERLMEARARLAARLRAGR